MSEETETTTIETKWGKISGKRTSELIAIFSLCIMAVGAYAFYKHEESTKEDNQQWREIIKETNKEFTAVIKDLTAATKVQNCLLKTEQKDRAAAFFECDRNSR